MDRGRANSMDLQVPLRRPQACEGTRVLCTDAVQTTRIDMVIILPVLYCKYPLDESCPRPAEDEIEIERTLACRLALSASPCLPTLDGQWTQCNEAVIALCDACRVYSTR